MLASIPNHCEQFYEFNPLIVDSESQQSQFTIQQSQCPIWPSLSSSYFHAASDDIYTFNTDPSFFDCYPMQIFNPNPVTPLSEAYQSLDYCSSLPHISGKSKNDQKVFLGSPYIVQGSPITPLKSDEDLPPFIDYPSTWSNQNFKPCDQEYKNMTAINNISVPQQFEDDNYGRSILQTTPLTPSSSQNDLFERRLKFAANQHLNGSSQASLLLAGQESTPFRNGSALAPTGIFLNNPLGLRFGTAAQLREQQKAESDAQVIQDQLRRSSTVLSSPTEITTISPRDVELTYHENNESLAPLFPVQQYATINGDDSFVQQQQLSCIPTACQQTNNISNINIDFSAQQLPVEAEAPRVEVPLKVEADIGTYTCTYHGCTLRFSTPAKLQHHKKESHRNPSAAATAAAAAICGANGNGMTPVIQRNSQAGPHKCERYNPVTGKKCNAYFSRPYDLTRHEDTIHNSHRKKVHCLYCKDIKSFSRNDALTRHLRIVHPNAPGRTIRRRRRSLK